MTKIVYSPEGPHHMQFLLQHTQLLVWCNSLQLQNQQYFHVRNILLEHAHEETFSGDWHSVNFFTLIDCEKFP